MNWKGYTKLGVAVGLLSAGLAWLFSTVKVPVVNLTMASVDINVRQQVTTGMSTGAGDKLLSYISGYIPFTMPGLVTILISSVIAVLIGGLAFEYGLKHVWQPAGKYAKMVTVLLLGTVISGLLLGAMSMIVALPSVAIMLTLGLYYAIVAYIIYLLDKKDILKVEI